MKVTKEENLQKRKSLKGLRNSKKRTVTTKSFNDSKNDFIPKIKHERNPDAELFKSLRNIGKISKKLKYNDWLFDYKKV